VYSLIKTKQNKMKKIKLGSEVVVSDPCYTIPTWCQIVLKDVKEGYYYPFIKRSNQGGWGNRVSCLCVIHEDHINDTEFKWRKKMGDLGVDSGQCGIFSKDTYKNDSIVESIVTPDIKFDLSGSEDGDKWYEKICKFTLSEDQWGMYDNGVVSCSGLGDGSYLLFVIRNEKKKVVGMLINYLLEDYIDGEFWKKELELV
jgi:hypothetical protein